jgi:membrane-associated phospholipid phosphatase
VAHQETSPALTILGVYLAVTAIPATIAMVRGGALAPAAAHYASTAMVAALWIRSRQPASTGMWRLLIDWLPLLAAPLLYAELPYLIAGVGAPFRDALVQQWESGLFGASPARTMAAALPNRMLSELLHAGYLSYYALIYAPPLLLYLRGDRAGFQRVSATVITVFAVCFAVFIVFPVAGPRYLWPAPPGIPDGPVRRAALALLTAGSSRGTAFPSSHVAVSVAQTLLALRLQPRAGVVTLVLTVLLALGAVYGGFHYAVDVLAGGLVGVVVTAFVRSRTTSTSAP